MDNAIKDYIESNRESIVGDVCRLIEKKSVRTEPVPGKPFGFDCADCLKEASALVRERGFTPVNYCNYALETTLGKGAPEVMLLAHLDVVPEGDGWKTDPYKAVVKEGLIFGRGATDDKGPAVSALWALKAVRELYGEPEKAARLVLGSGEETGSEDMDFYFSVRPSAGYTLSPDADYPLINIEKGRFAPVFEKRISQPSCGAGLEKIDGGKTSNIVPGKAYALVSGIGRESVQALLEGIGGISVGEENGLVKIFAEGKSSHAAFPEGGINANTLLLGALEKIPFASSETAAAVKSLNGLFPHLQTDGENAGVKMSDEESGALTLNMGVLSYENGVLRFGLDLRCPVSATEENVKNVILKNTADAGFEICSGSEMRPAHVVDRNSPLIKEALKVFEDCTGRKGGCLAIGGGTYVHDIEGGIAFGPEFEGTDYRIHGADEFAVIDEILVTARMYAEIIHDLCY